MSRQRSDPNEVRSLGPLFDLTSPTGPLYARFDPKTSRKAAGRMKGERLGSSRDFALRMIRQFPACTAPELGQHAVRIYGGDPEVWRQRIGRRANELKKLSLADTRGTEYTDPMQRWWAVEETP